MQKLITLSALLIIILMPECNKQTQETPNILWITSEDNSPMLGCYGDTFATTPNLDQLASEGFLYTHVPLIIRIPDMEQQVGKQSVH